jgi:S1-C subfamily serine protease
MAKSNFRRIRVVRNWDDARGYGPQDRVLVEVEREWARAVVSLIKMSDEYRHVGLLVINVGPTSRAAIAGVARGDMLLRYNGVQLDNAETLRDLTVRAMQDYEPRKRVALEALRGAHEMTFEVEGGALG